MMEIGNSFLLRHYMDTVWAIKPERLQMINEVIVEKLQSGSLELALSGSENNRSDSPYVERHGSTAILRIEGTLVPKCSWLDAMCGMVSTLELHNEFNKLVEDPTLQRIVLYIDSPGGAVVGVPEFAESIFKARSEKEIVSFVDVMAASGGYYLWSAAENAIATPSAIIGSVGVYTTIIKKNKNESDKYTTTIIQAGANKTFGHPEIELSTEEVNYFRESVESTYDKFTSDVARFRGVSQDEVKLTEASVYDAESAPSWMLTEVNNADYVLS